MMRRPDYVAPKASSKSENRALILAHNLHERMAAKGWRQADLAREAERFLVGGKRFGRHLISSYCTGKSWPTAQNLEAMSRALGCEIAELAPPAAVSVVPAEPPALTLTMTRDGWARVEISAEMSAAKAARLVALLNESDDGPGAAVPSAA